MTRQHDLSKTTVHRDFYSGPQYELDTSYFNVPSATVGAFLLNGVVFLQRGGTAISNAAQGKECFLTTPVAATNLISCLGNLKVKGKK